MDQKYFLIVLLASLRTTYLLKFGCIWNTAALPRLKTTVSSMVSRKTLVLGYHLHRKHNISIYTGKQYFHSEKYQRPCFRASPQSPQTAHEGGESSTPFPNVSLRVLTCPFRALSPCPIQILAGALKYVVTPHKNCLETILMMGHNICFEGIFMENYPFYPFISGALCLPWM